MPKPTISDYAQEKYRKLKAQNAVGLNNVSMAQAYMPPENAAADPLSQPSGKKLAEEEKFIGKSFSAKDPFTKRMMECEGCGRSFDTSNPESDYPYCGQGCRKLTATESHITEVNSRKAADDDAEEEEEQIVA